MLFENLNELIELKLVKTYVRKQTNYLTNIYGY